MSGYEKLGEVPYDFLRKRLSILVSQGDARFMVTKGTLTDVLAVCSRAECPPAGSGRQATAARRRRRRLPGPSQDASLAAAPQIQAHYAALSAEGYRVLGVAYRDLRLGAGHIA